MSEKISELMGFLTIIGIVVLIILLIVFVEQLCRKKNWKFPVKMCVLDILLIIIFTIAGSAAYSKTDSYKEYLAQREIAEKERIEKEEKDKLEKEKTEQEEEEKRKKEEKGKVEKEDRKKEEEEKINTESEEKKKLDGKEAEEKIDSKTEGDKFLSDLNNALGEEVADGAYDVLVNQIGFSELEFKERMGETANYEIIADNTYMVITAMDGFYRVFIPNTSYVFYEDGTVKMTAQEFSDKTISNDDRIVYYIMAQDIVSNNLKNPSSASFPSINFDSQDISMAKTGDIITVQNYVDAKNSFNAKVRSKWTVQFIAIDKSAYSYQATYINIDGKSTGEYTEIE